MSLQGTGILTAEQLDSVACTLSGDPKSLEQVGTKATVDGRPRLTWIKLSAVNASALRLALHDPQTRVLTRRPEPARHPRVLSMEVQGGFLDGLTLRFNDDLRSSAAGGPASRPSWRHCATPSTAPYTPTSPSGSLWCGMRWAAAAVFAWS